MVHGDQGQRQCLGGGGRCNDAVESKQPEAPGGSCWLSDNNVLFVCVAHALALRSVSRAMAFVNIQQRDSAAASLRYALSRLPSRLPANPDRFLVLSGG